MVQTRVERLKKLVEKHQVDAYIEEDSINLFYLTGIPLSTGTYVITPNEATLYVDGRYQEMCRDIPGEPIDSLDLSKYQTLGFSRDKTTVKRAERFKNKTKPLDDLVSELRIIKDETELDLMRKAADLGSKGYDFVCKQLKAGVTELEVAAELDIFWKREGAKGVAFDPIIAFGAHSSMPHYHPDNTKLKSGDAVLIDIGVTLNHYHSDMTRVHAFGDMDPELHRVYQIVADAQQAALDLCKPGTKIGDLDSAARDLIKEAGYGDAFSHGLGHGIGLEVHEGPTLRNKAPFAEAILEPGMVITIEPGIYISGLGGVRLEDTVVITPQGHENLTKRPLATQI